ncbi:MAG: hypothetical protein DRP68_03250 [Candidatus Omnitrophota bacterium]|nr:MAG: hypothetical protein DRP68_03250 [Candidatus Omnitrophota bacterium]
MGIYVYKAVDTKGKIVKGKIEAPTETDVSIQLAKLGYIPISIGFKGEKAPPLRERLFKKRFRRTSHQALVIFTRQFATLVKAAVPIIEGLKVLAEQAEDDNLKEALYKVIEDIEEGKKLSEALSKHPGVFSQLYVNTVIAGETGGVLDKILLRLAEVLEQEQETKADIKSALRYPIMVIIALFIAVMVLSTLVVPQFGKIYRGMDINLPLPTQIMIFVSASFKNYWFITFPVLIGLFFLFRFFINTPGGRLWWDNLKFNIPIFGKIYRKITMLRFASMLNVLYQAGLPVLNILDVVKITIGNVVLAKDLDNVKRFVADGKGISGGLFGSKLFPPLVSYMVSVGEKAGALSTMLDSLCEYYSLEVKTSLKNLTSLVEPIMTLVLGAVVGGMALAIFLPMWNLISIIRK